MRFPLYAMNTASNWTEFSAALSQWCWPTQNVVYSDDQGHIAYHAVGKVPIRPAGIASMPIADAAHEWQGYIPFDEMPNAFDPPSGFLATANSRVTSDKSHYPLTDEWADPYRAERIYKLLQGRDQLKPTDMLAVQTDIYSEVDQELGHRLAYAIDHTANADDQLRKAADLMRSWDGRLTTDSAAASLVTQTRYALRTMLLEPKLGKRRRRLRLVRIQLRRRRDRDARQPRLAPTRLQGLGRVPHRRRPPRHERRQGPGRHHQVDLRLLARR